LVPRRRGGGKRAKVEENFIPGIAWGTGGREQLAAPPLKGEQSRHCPDREGKKETRELFDVM